MKTRKKPSFFAPQKCFAFFRETIFITAIILLIVSLIPLVTSYEANAENTPRLVLTLLNQDPDPVEPGEVVKVRLKVENNGTQTEDNIRLEIVPKYPFQQYGEKTINVGHIRALQSGADAVIVEFKLKVADDAAQGNATFDIKATAGDITQTFKDFLVRTKTKDTILSISSIESDPETISPGETANVHLTMKNNADSLIREVKVKMNLSGGVPFAPGQSSTEKQLYQVAPNTIKLVSFNIVALPDANGGIYRIPLTITYTDEARQSYVKEDFISLKVSSPPEILVTISDYKEGEKSPDQLAFRITNRGLTNLKLLTATLNETSDIKILSNNEVYVGNIDSDDYETADFKINILSRADTIAIPIQLSFRDATNKPYTQELKLDLVQSNYATTSGRGGSTTIIILVIIILTFGGYYFYRKRKKA